MKCKICGKKTKIWYKKLFDDRHGYPGYSDVIRCTICGFGQTKPQISKRVIKKLYKDYYPRQKIDLSKIKPDNYKAPPKFKLWRKGLLNGCHFLVRPGSKVLDVGSGLGFSLFYLTNMSCKAYGIDPDENAEKLAKKINLNFHHGFIEDNPFDNIKFDYVISNQTIEHTNNPIVFLKLCKERLKTDGKIILSFPNTGSLTRRLLGKNWLHWHIPYHLNHFNKKSLGVLAEKVNLKIEKIETVTPNMWTNIQIKRLTNKPKMGKRDYFWDGEQNTEKKVNKSLKRIFVLMEEYNLLNRLIDSTGLGESFVVTLSAS